MAKFHFAKHPTGVEYVRRSHLRVIRATANATVTNKKKQPKTSIGIKNVSDKGNAAPVFITTGSTRLSLDAEVVFSVVIFK